MRWLGLRSFNPLQRGELPATQKLQQSASATADTFQSPPTRGTTCHKPERVESLRLTGFQSPPTRGTTCHITPCGLWGVIVTWFQSPPTRGTTCHVSNTNHHEHSPILVSIPSNAGNYLPHPACSGLIEVGQFVSIPSNAGNYLPLLLVLSWYRLQDPFQSPPTRGTTCHNMFPATANVTRRVSIPSNAGNYLPPLLRSPSRRPIPTCFNPLQRGELPATSRITSWYTETSGHNRFNPLQRGELPATRGGRLALLRDPPGFQSPPTRGTTCHSAASHPRRP